MQGMLLWLAMHAPSLCLWPVYSLDLDMWVLRLGNKLDIMHLKRSFLHLSSAAVLETTSC
eukprot:2694437-Pleurochrysis_carterae.AAC.1